MSERGTVSDRMRTETIRDEDWYGRDLDGETFDRVAFVGVDLTEATTRGCSFTECTFRDVRFNVSLHTDTAFVNCAFMGCNFFDARFERCKLTGSIFDACSFDLTRVDGGNWSFVALPAAPLGDAVFTGVRLREADLTRAKLAGGVLSGCDLSGAAWLGADLTGCDLRDSDLSSLDPAEVRLKGARITGEQASVLVAALGLIVEDD
jgi:fluoroquinolone resistance protein